MAITNVWTNNTNPPDTEAANLMYAEVRKLRQDVVDRLTAMSTPNMIANPPALEAQFAGMISFDTTTGRVYQFSGGDFNDITNQLLDNIASMPITGSQALTFPAGATFVSPKITQDSTDPSIVPELTTTPTAAQGAATPSLLINADFVQRLLTNNYGAGPVGYGPINATGSSGLVVSVRFPIAFTDNVPTLYLQFEAGICTALGNNQPVAFNPIFSTTPIIIVSPQGDSSDQGSCNFTNPSAVGFNMNSSNSIANNWFAIGFAAN